MIVLEPISTKNLTTEDVSNLALHAHGLMEAALREISISSENSSHSSVEQPAPITPVETENQRDNVDETTNSVDSTSPERRHSEGSVVETESDEGMVVIRKS